MTSTTFNSSGNFETGISTELEVRSSTGGEAASVLFHQPGNFATYFGLKDGDFYQGSYSDGAVKHKFYTSKNFDLLGKNIGINWRPYEERILVDRFHAAAAQSAMEIQVRTRAGTLPGATGLNDGVGNAFAVVSEVNRDTKYGHFNLVTQSFNDSVYVEGQDQFFGHVSAALYGVQKRVDATSMWAIAAEVKETHGQSNPINASLAAELTVIGTGTDDHNKRCMLFLPTNVLNNSGAYTEFAQGIFWKTAPNSIYKDAMLLEGSYNYVLRAHDDRFNADPSKRQPFSAKSLIKVDGGDFSQPIIDLGYAYSAGNGCALQINADHHIRWNTAEGQITQKLGRLGDTMFIDGLPWSGSAGPQVGYVTIVLNGTRLKVPCHLES